MPLDFKKVFRVTLPMSDLYTARVVARTGSIVRILVSQIHPDATHLRMLAAPRPRVGPLSFSGRLLREATADNPIVEAYPNWNEPNVEFDFIQAMRVVEHRVHDLVALATNDP